MKRAKHKPQKEKAGLNWPMIGVFVAVIIGALVLTKDCWGPKIFQAPTPTPTPTPGPVDAEFRTFLDSAKQVQSKAYQTGSDEGLEKVFCHEAKEVVLQRLEQLRADSSTMRLKELRTLDITPYDENSGHAKTHEVWEFFPKGNPTPTIFEYEGYYEIKKIDGEWCIVIAVMEYVSPESPIKKE